MIKDVNEFVEKFLSKTSKPEIHPEISTRLAHLHEELEEIEKAVAENNLEELIDGLLDLTYIAIGTGLICGFDIQAHWDEIQRANMSKVRGRTKRNSAFDVCKPEDWTPPNHTKILNKE